MWTSIKVLSCLSVFASMTLTAQPTQPQAVPDGVVVSKQVFDSTMCKNGPITLNNATIVFVQLELDDGCILRFNPSFKMIGLTILNLTLHGKSMIDVSAQPVTGTIFPKAPTPPQVGYNAHGTNGAPGAAGSNGAEGPHFIFEVFNVTAPDGSLWVKTDGSAGTPGSPGSDGGKGGGPNTSGLSCTDGGQGGDGGAGGAGGRGGNTTLVSFELGPRENHVPVGANLIPGVAPSTRPSSADIPGAVVVAGSPGAGAAGGPGGSGGGGGEGRKCGFPASDAKPGAPGGHGPNGPTGANGIFTP